MLKALLMLFVILSIVSCSTQEIVYKDRYKEKLVPVKCEVPDVECDFNRSTNTEVVASMLECIVDLKKTIEVCK